MKGGTKDEKKRDASVGERGNRVVIVRPTSFRQFKEKKGRKVMKWALGDVTSSLHSG